MFNALLSSYPPQVSEANLKHLKELSIDWALSHGVVIRPPADLALANNSSVIHAPLALFPSPFPKKAFEKGLLLQPLFNLLFHRLTKDNEYIKEIMNENNCRNRLSKGDDFIEKLYNIYLTVNKEGISQPISLSISRSDYLLHLPSGANEPKILQVEYNTIASSFSSLSTLATDMHRYLLKSTNYFDSSSIIKNESLPQNEAMDSLVKGIAKAHELYGSQNAVVVIIIQPNERNAFDQRWIEYKLLENYNVQMIRKTLTEIGQEGRLDPETKALHIDDKEISVAYFRSAYGPADYLTEKDWDIRLLIERSRSIKCPTVAYQLVGSKKIQQMLTNPGVLERYISNESDVQNLRSCFAGHYPLDASSEGEVAANLALKHPEDYVMKPQREGGGNNIYSTDIPKFISGLSLSERSTYILMDIIQSPLIHNFLLRQGELIEGDMISELGIYGVFIGTSNSDFENESIVNETAGHLLRTKPKETNEGGVASGFAVIDSPLLI
ncbi:7597_t:CDS:10 [Ambispora gerdemannii]|uniref:Glutathione synthetase n=1 Tax=Ambispora gerdemannii TaxID=144530 RepID=A0A9N9F6W7_9GLOM|nr:7597_t:CDS:10 [Ambispora gerdemannii]